MMAFRAAILLATLVIENVSSNKINLSTKMNSLEMADSSNNNMLSRSEDLYSRIANLTTYIRNNQLTTAQWLNLLEEGTNNYFAANFCLASLLL